MYEFGSFGIIFQNRVLRAHKNGPVTKLYKYVFKYVLLKITPTGHHKKIVEEVLQMNLLLYSSQLCPYFRYSLFIIFLFLTLFFYFNQF